MTEPLTARPRPPAPLLAGYAGALLMVAGVTLLGLMIAPRWGTTAVVLLYLPPVLAAAIYCGTLPALIAAVAAALAYNFYFTQPYRTFVIHSPADVMTVVVLFLVALVTSHLASSLRRQVSKTAAHAARNATIAGFARRLLGCASDTAIAEASCRELARLFACNAVLIEAGDPTRLVASVPASAMLAPSDFAAAAYTLESGEAAGRGVARARLADWQFRAVEANGQVIAALGLARDDGVPPVEEDQLPLLGNLLDQVALALDRARLEREAREVAALRERDRMRSALLASIGEDIKPRLKTIAEAARTLRRGGEGPNPEAAAITAETTRLDRYLDNLADLSPGADPTPIEIGPLTIDLHHRRVRRDGEEVRLTPKEWAVLAELAKHAGRVLTHAQLLRAIWGPAHEDHVDYLRVAVRALRQKLECDPADPELIVNEPAVGYRLVAPARTPAEAAAGAG